MIGLGRIQRMSLALLNKASIKKITIDPSSLMADVKKRKILSKVKFKSPEKGFFLCSILRVFLLKILNLKFSAKGCFLFSTFQKQVPFQ
jgi:hypothetical protein